MVAVQKCAVEKKKTKQKKNIYIYKDPHHLIEEIRYFPLHSGRAGVLQIRNGIVSVA